MSLCACGNATDGASASCARCAALQTLELKPEATQDEIKAAYHLLVKVWHPDRFQGDAKLKQAADEKLKAINSAYLLLSAKSSGKAQRRAARKAQNPPQDNSSQQAASAVPPTAAPAPAVSRRGRFGSYLATFAAFSLAQRLLVLGCGLGVSALFMKYVDYELSTDPETSIVYIQYKSALAHELEAPRQRLVATWERGLRALNPNKAAATALPVVQLPASGPDRVSPAPSGAAVRHVAARAPRSLAHLTPLITVGLTRDEVIAAAGAPISSTEDKLFYPGAEITFKDGRLSGWTVDPATSALRVKLWPEGPVDSELRFFAVGSTRDDVLAVQGTPTRLAPDTFGYGSSEVYFERNRVVSWKNDPTSAPLRVVNR